MKYTKGWLENQVKQGAHKEYIFFWGHTQKHEGVIDKFCFSQWFPAIFTVEGITYATAEHWMMAKKALLFDDKEQYQQILSTESPDQAKKCGRAVKNFDPEVWSAHAYELVIEGNLHKFSQHQEMGRFLRNTTDAVIVEASPVDKIWGIGTRTHEISPIKWRGTNLLGFALMEVRDRLK